MYSLWTKNMAYGVNTKPMDTKFSLYGLKLILWIKIQPMDKKKSYRTKLQPMDKEYNFKTKRRTNSLEKEYKQCSAMSTMDYNAQIIHPINFHMDLYKK